MGVLTQIWEAIPVYTGLSSVTFCTLVAIVIAAYYIVNSLFAPPPLKYVPMEPLPPPVQLGFVTEEELRQYDGSDPKKPLLMAIRGVIYDVSQSRAFYGPGGPYALFAGRDASRALAKMTFDNNDLTSDTTGLTAYEMDALNEWELKFQSKYQKVGEIPKTRDIPVEEAPKDPPASKEGPSTEEAKTE